MHASRRAVVAAIVWSVTLAASILFAVAKARASETVVDDARAVLERFVGDWNTQTQVTHFGPAPREFNSRATANCQPTLEGQYFEFRTESTPPGDADLQIMTYDAAAHVYRQWVFSSDGYRHEATGIWDPATSILRWTGKTGDATFVIDDHWVSADQLDWTLERRDSSGQVTQAIRGRISRSKS